MLRRVSRALNLALAALALFLALRIADDLSRALAWQPPPEPASDAVALEATPRARTWKDVEQILERNLFHVAIAEPEIVPVEPVETVEPTELPLGLLGTISSTDSQLGAAVIWVDPIKQRFVLTEGDELVAWDAKIVEIERGRVVLSEDGELRELSIEEDSEYRPPKQKPRRRRGRRFRRSAR